MIRQPDDPGIETKPAQPGFFNKLIITTVLVLTLISSCVARAHEWYPFECCSGRDCSEISANAVREVSGGFLVSILPGDHPMWGVEKTETLRISVPYRKLKPSPDGKWHICIGPSGNFMCFFGPFGGV